MSEEPSLAGIDKKLNRLSMTVLVLGIFMFLGLYRIENTVGFSSAEPKESMRSQLTDWREPFGVTTVDFDIEKLRKTIREASAIVQLNTRMEGGKETFIVEAVLKENEKVNFRYKSGDEYPHLSHSPVPKEKNPDGWILFFSGDDPSSYQQAVTYFDCRINPAKWGRPILTPVEPDYRIGAFADMPLPVFKDVVAEGRREGGPH